MLRTLHPICPGRPARGKNCRFWEPLLLSTEGRGESPGVVRLSGWQYLHINRDLDAVDHSKEGLMAEISGQVRKTLLSTGEVFSGLSFLGPGISSASNLFTQCTRENVKTKWCRAAEGRVPPEHCVLTAPHLRQTTQGWGTLCPGPSWAEDGNDTNCKKTWKLGRTNKKGIKKQSTIGSLKEVVISLN